MNMTGDHFRCIDDSGRIDPLINSNFMEDLRYYEHTLGYSWNRLGSRG